MIDGDGPVDFDLLPGSEAAPPLPGLFYFKVDNLLEGALHNLTVVNSRLSTRLVLNRLLVKGGDFRITSEVPPPVHSPSDSPSDVPRSNSTAVKIAGALIGAFAFFALGFLGAYLEWRIKRNKETRIDARLLNDSNNVPLHSVASQGPSTSPPWPSTNSNNGASIYAAATRNSNIPQSPTSSSAPVIRPVRNVPPSTSAAATRASQTSPHSTRNQLFPAHSSFVPQSAKNSPQSPEAISMPSAPPLAMTNAPFVQGVMTDHGDVNIALGDVHHHAHYYR